MEKQQQGCGQLSLCLRASAEKVGMGGMRGQWPCYTWEVVEEVEGEGEAGGLSVAQGRLRVT